MTFASTSSHVLGDEAATGSVGEITMTIVRVGMLVRSVSSVRTSA